MDTIDNDVLERGAEVLAEKFGSLTWEDRNEEQRDQWRTISGLVLNLCHAEERAGQGAKDVIRNDLARMIFRRFYPQQRWKEASDFATRVCLDTSTDLLNALEARGVSL